MRPRTRMVPLPRTESAELSSWSRGSFPHRSRSRSRVRGTREAAQISTILSFMMNIMETVQWSHLYDDREIPRRVKTKRVGIIIMISMLPSVVTTASSTNIRYHLRCATKNAPPSPPWLGRHHHCERQEEEDLHVSRMIQLLAAELWTLNCYQSDICVSNIYYWNELFYSTL